MNGKVKQINMLLSTTDKRALKWFAGVFAFICTLNLPVFISDNSLHFTNSVISICFFVVIWMLIYSEWKEKWTKRRVTMTHILGFVYSFFIATGYSLDTYGIIIFRSVFFSIILYTHVIACVISKLWRLLYCIDRADGLTQEPKWYKHIINRPYIVFIVLLVCWTPFFVAEFPGAFRFDATQELMQAENGYCGDFPLLHSAIITTMLPLANRITGSYDMGVTVYTIIQMIVCASMYTQIIIVFAKKGINWIIWLFIFLYCSLFPVVQIIVGSEVRDALFSILLTYTVFSFYQMCVDRRRFFENKRYIVKSSLLFVLTLYARNNNAGGVSRICSILVFLAILILNIKSYRKGALTYSISGIVFYFVIGYGLTMICQPMISQPSIGSSLSLFSQSIARSYVMERESWSDKELEEASRFIDLEGVIYVTENADLTKGRIHNDINLRDFLVFWAKLGKNHIGCYVDALLAQTQNMWFPASVIDGYKQQYTTEGEPYYEWDKTYHAIGEGHSAPVSHLNLTPRILDYYTSIGLRISFEKIPVISMMFSIGFQFWLIIHCVGYLIYRKMYKLVMPIMIVMAYMVFSAFVPLVLLRYFAAAFLCHPFILFFTCQPSIASSEQTGI